MNGSTLGTEVFDALVAAGVAIDSADARTAWDEIGKAIVSHIQNNAVVTTTVPAAGLLDGTSAPCSGTAAGSGTIA
jgi:hypothetical protein